MTYVDLDDDVDSVDAAMETHPAPTAAHAHQRMPRPEMMKPAETVDDQVKEDKPVERGYQDIALYGRNTLRALQCRRCMSPREVMCVSIVPLPHFALF